MNTDQTRPPAGERFARYRVLARLGGGEMGEVYRARDEQLDRDVAIRVLAGPTFDDPAARAQLLREARATAALNHPHICTVYEVGESNRQTYIAMEVVEGQPLSVHLDAGALPPEQVIRYALHLAHALAHAHERGVIHRNLKSANVIVTPDGRVKVLDFGLPKRSTRSELTASDDIRSFGVLLDEMATGSDVPPALQSIIHRCLEEESTRRYRTGGEVHAALEGIRSDADRRAEGRSIAASATLSPGSKFWLTRRRAIWLGAAAAISAASGLATFRLWPRSVAVRSLAVLPFTNAKQDADIDYLCEGVAESLIRQISRLRSVRVSSLSTALNFKGQAAAPSTAGRQLGVETILAGTVERQGTRLLISAQLVDVANGSPLWTKAYDRDAADLLDVQDRIASAIMDDGLRLRLDDEERRDVVRHLTTDGQAYHLYLQARHLQRRATEDGYLAARELLERAIGRDPKFAQAYGALSGTYAMMVTDGFERPTDAWPEVSRHARKALELDPQMPEAHAYAHAVAFLFHWDWADAERERRLLLQSLAGDFDPQVLRALAVERWALGRPDEALQLARRARELDRLSPFLAIFEADYLVYAGQLDAAVVVYEKAISLEPDNPNPFFGLAETRSRQGRFDDAIEARRQAHARAGDDELKDVLATARGEKGYREIDRTWVRLQLDWLKNRATTGYVSPLDYARAYAQLDDKEQAFKYLDAAFVDRAPGLVFLKVDRAWNNVRGDPRFAAAVRRVGLP